MGKEQLIPYDHTHMGRCLSDTSHSSYLIGLKRGAREAPTLSTREMRSVREWSWLDVLLASQVFRDSVWIKDKVEN